MVGEIAPKQDFTATGSASELGQWTLTRYHSSFSIPEGAVLIAPENILAFKAPSSSLALYE